MQEVSRAIGILGLLAVTVSLPRLRLVSQPAFWTVSVLAVASLRVSQILLVSLGVPDSGRSVILSGFQVHHIAFGVIICLAALLVGVSRTIGHSKTMAWVYGVGIALIIDEAFYMLFTRVTDQDYLGWVSYLGVPLLYAGILWYLQVPHVNSK